MSEYLSFFVPGLPKGQPRVKACIRGKHAGVYDPGTADAWKMAVAESWRYTKMPTFIKPVRVTLECIFPRPKSHFGSGKNAQTLKLSAPLFHTSKPDADNLAKAILDVLTRLKAWQDDSLVFDLRVIRQWDNGSSTGARITIEGVV